MTTSPIPVPTRVSVCEGPALLAGVTEGIGLAAHRARYGPLPSLGLAGLSTLVEQVALRGRGGAAFPFATKLAAATKGRRPVVVVNLSEGEPASAKDHALATTRPHLVLDGAVATARALRAREVHLVLPGDRSSVGVAIHAAVAERPESFVLHVADNRFVAGQAQAVLQLMSGRPNLPVTAWQPEAVSGHRRLPTLLSNAETWARVGLLVLRGVAAYSAIGTRAEPGAALLTLGSPGRDPVVVEAEYGTRLRDHLPGWMHQRPALVGGFHGSWATWQTLANAIVSVDGMRLLGSPLGAGVVLSTPPGTCPVRFTADVVDYLAGQSAGRCGPCLNGLPALASAVRAVVDGTGGMARVHELTRLVERRGACAHPDGTVRLVRSMLATFADEAEQHAHEHCSEVRRLHVVRAQELAS